MYRETCRCIVMEDLRPVARIGSVFSEEWVVMVLVAIGVIEDEVMQRRG